MDHRLRANRDGLRTRITNAAHRNGLPAGEWKWGDIFRIAAGLIVLILLAGLAIAFFIAARKG